MGIFKKESNTSNEDLKLSELELKDFELFKARADIQVAVLEKLKLTEQIMKIEHAQQIAIIKSKIKDASNSLENCKQDYNNHRVLVSDRLNVNLDDYTILENGTLNKIETTDNE